jgi:thiol-disulfide isomerase/thioredoxin
MFMDNNLLRRRSLLHLGLGIVGAGAATVVLPHWRKASTAPRSAPQSNLSTSEAVAATPSGEVLPDFQGISEWLNSSPLTVTSLKGSVVLVQFWTFACINCQRTLPYVVQWHRQYGAQGLKVIGIHTPEFAYEREVNNVKRAVQQRQITYPVAIDNDYKTWNAYGNNYWPHLYLADRQGVRRYDHIGEGSYDETEQTIRKLLGES